MDLGRVMWQEAPGPTATAGLGVHLAVLGLGLLLIVALLVCPVIRACHVGPQTDSFVPRTWWVVEVAANAEVITHFSRQAPAWPTSPNVDNGRIGHVVALPLAHDDVEPRIGLAEGHPHALAG